jgi:hypothetical protein
MQGRLGSLPFFVQVEIHVVPLYACMPRKS